MAVGEMDGRALEILERIARNLPVKPKSLRFCRYTSDIGEIYYAYGKDINGVYHGVWGSRGTAQPIEFRKRYKVGEKWHSVTEKIVQAVLIDAAQWFLQKAQSKGLLSEGPKSIDGQKT